MTPEFLHKVTKARQTYFALPAEDRPAFLEQLRTNEPEVATELAATLWQEQDSKPQPETVDRVGPADGGGTGDNWTTDYHKPATDAYLPERIGRYAIDAKLGEGGMGVVYRGRDPDVKRFLAVKVLKEGRQEDAGLCRRFLEEAQIMGQLQHPGIAPIHEIGSLDDGRPFFSMKQIQGKTLAELLERKEAGADLPRFVSIFGQVCQTLAYAHSQGILHRDLKPHNIMVGAFGEVQVMDWGLAKLVRGPSSVVCGLEKTEASFVADSITAPEDSMPTAEPRTTDHELRTRAGVVMGTPAYMAPEQARGEIQALDERADVFGLGAILCDILTGSPVFRGGSAKVKVRLAANGNLQDAFERLDRCDADLDLVGLAKKCLAPEREDRPDDGADVAEAIDRYEQQVQERLRLAELEKAAAQAKAASERKRRRMTLAFAVTVILLILTGTGAFLGYQKVRADAALAKAEQQRQLRESLRAALTEREKLIADLKKEGGVFRLLNEPNNWQQRLKIITGHCKRASDLHRTLGNDTDEKFQDQIEALNAKLQQDQRDFDHAVLLNRIREERSVWVNGQFRYMVAVEKYPKVFSQAGFDLHRGDLKEMARQIVKSPIKDQWLAALCDWALVRLDYYKFVKSKLPWVRIAALAYHIEKNPLRKRVYFPEVWFNPEKCLKTAKEFLDHPKQFSQLPPQALELMGRLLNYRHKKEAQRWFRNARLVYPQEFFINFSLGSMQLGLKRNWNDPALAEVASCFRIAVAINPRSTAAWTNLGSVLADQKKFEEAIGALNRALEIDPRFKEAWANLADVLADQKKFEQAIAAYKTALEIDPKFETAWNNLGLVLDELGKHSEAVNAYNKALSIDPNLKETWMNLGSALYHQENLDEAAVAYKKAIQIDRKFKAAWLNLGNILVAQKKLTEGVHAYNQALKIDPNYELVWTHLGLALRAQHKPDEAILAHNKALEINPKCKQAWINLGALQCDVLYQYQKAEQSFRKAIQIDPRERIAWFNLGNALQSQNKLNEAAAAYKKAVQIDPKSHNTWFVLGNTLRKLEKCDEAVAAYRKALDVDPKLKTAWNKLGALQCDVLHQYQKAEQAFRNAIQIDRKYYVAWSNLGNALRKQNKLPEAVDAYNKALNIEPNYKDGWINLGVSLRKQNKGDEAVAAYQKALAIDPKCTESWTNLGNVLADQKKPDEAIRTIQKALAIDPKFKKAWYTLGLVLATQKKFDEAERAFRKVLQLSPNNGEAWFALGSSLSSQNKLDNAETAYQKAIQINPKYKQAWYKLGKTHWLKKKLDEAVAAYQKAIQIDSEYDQAWYELGGALFLQKKFVEAAKAYNQTLKIDPKNKKAWINLGAVYCDALHQYQNAEQAFEKAIEIDPKDAAAWINLGIAFRNQRKFEKAQLACNKALEIDPENEEAWADLGAALDKQNKLDEAVEAYKRAIEIDPNHKRAWGSLGATFQRLNSFDEAAAAYRKAIKIDPKYKAAWINLGVLQYKIQEYQKAGEAFRKANRIDPNDPIPWSNLGGVLRGQDKFDEAIAAYKRALQIQPRYPGAQAGLAETLFAQGKFREAASAYQTLIQIVPRGQRHARDGLLQLQKCQRLLSLEKKLPDVLLGKHKASVGEQIILAEICSRFKKRYQDAVKLYSEVFVKDPKLAADLRYEDRYKAACAATMAAAGKGANTNNLRPKVRADFRQQAHSWLQSDLQSYQKLLKKSALTAVFVQSRLKKWLNDPALSTLRERTSIAKLPKDERGAWQKLWSDVQTLQMNACNSYTETTFRGFLSTRNKEQPHTHKMTAGKIHVIEMQSNQFDTLLRLHDAAGNKLAENDDINFKRKILNSRIVFSPKQEGVYRIIATSFKNKGRGAYEIIIRVFSGGKGIVELKDPPPKKGKPKPPPAK